MLLDFPTRDEISGIIAETAQAVADKLRVYVPPVFTKKQVAAYLDKPISTVDRYMKEGLPYYKADENSYPEFSREQVDNWIRERFQKVQRKEDHGEGQELVQRNVVYLAEDFRPDNSSCDKGRPNKRASGSSRT